MAEILKTVDFIKRLNIQELPDEWVRDVIEQDFTDSNDLPLPIEDEIQNSNYHVENLIAVKKLLHSWVNGAQGPEGQGFWTVLVENDLPHKRLLCLLQYILAQGQKRLANIRQRLAGLAAADLYFTMVMVPGSGAFKVFHPVMFQNAMDAFKIWKTLEAPTKRKRNSSPIRPSQLSQQRASKTRKRARNSGPEEHGDEEESDEEEQSSMTAQEINKLNSALFKLLTSFVQVLKTYPLRDVEDAAYHSLQIVADLSKLEPETFDGNFDENCDIKDLRTVPELAFRGLVLISSNAHGDVKTMTDNVLKHLLPSVLMYIGENKAIASQNIPRHFVMVKDHAIAFVSHLLKIRPESWSSVKTLIQHMCTKVPDKADYRAKVSQAIVAILKELSNEAYAKIMEWIFKFGRHQKMAYRGFALDLAGMLIQEPERRQDVDVNNADSSSLGDMGTFLQHSFLLQMILSRCSDTAPTVRARAITVFSTCTSSTQPTIVKAVKDVMTPAMGGTGMPAARPAKSRIRVSTDGAPLREPPTNQSPLPSINSTGPHADTIASARPSIEGTIRSGRNSIETALAASILRNAEGGAARPSPLVTIELTPGVEITLTDGQGVVSMLRRRARDEKVNVRKASLQALQHLVLLNKEHTDDKDLEILNERCRDPSLAVRKQAMQCLTELLLDLPRDKKVQKHFLDGVLPMVLDRETTAQDKTMATLADLLLGNIVKYDRCTEDENKMVWELLNFIAGNQGVELRRYLFTACQHWGKTAQYKKDFVGSLKTHIGTENNIGVWMMLSEVTRFIPNIDASFVLDYWNDHAKNAPASEFSTVQRVLVVLEHIAGVIGEQQVSDITVDLKQRLMRFDLPPEIISSCVTTLYKLCNTLTGDKEVADKMTKEWFVDLLKACDSYLSHVILNEKQDEPINEDKVVCHLFTLGEIAQLCPDKTPKRVFMLVQSLIATPTITTIDGSTQQNTLSQSATSDTNTADLVSQSSEVAASEGQQRAETSGSSDVMMSSSQNNSQGSQLSTQGSQFSQALSQFRGCKMSSRIRAHAFITLGKLCLQHEDIAKKCVAAMARELEMSGDPAVRNNVVIILCDLCVRYTTLVDRYLCNISSCIKDDSVLVRKQTLTLLTHLLQEDFLKWKGSLFYRFVMAVVDENAEIRQFAEFCLVHLLRQRHPAMFYQHFVECVFHFNNYDQHSVYNKFKQTDREKKMFSLKGQHNFKKRERIYSFLLEHMTDEQKFQLVAKLGQDMLGAVVDDVLPLDMESSALLQDTLTILASKEIKLSSLKCKPQQDEIETEQEMAAAVMNAAKKTLISQVMKRNVIENIVPTVIAIKHMLEKHRSPVIKNLMLYLRELMKDYKNEVKDFLTSDRQLAGEIEFDLRKFEEDQQRELEQQATPRNNTAGGSPRLNAGSPKPRRAPGNPHQPQTPATTTPGRKPGTPAHRTPDRAVAVGGGAETPVRDGGEAKTPARTATPARTGTPIVPNATPGRNMSMSTIAILNSARKAMETAKRVSEKQRQKTPQRLRLSSAEVSPKGSSSVKTPDNRKELSSQILKTVKKVAFSQSTDKGEVLCASEDPTPVVQEESTQSNTAADSFKSPERVNRRNRNADDVTRAFSTPTGHIGNLTFQQGEHNISMIPMSPITDVSSTSPTWSTKEVEDANTGNTEHQPVLHLFSPDKPAPRKRVWNIKSPAPHVLAKENNPPKQKAKTNPRKGRSSEALDISDTSMLIPETNNEGANNSRRRSSRKTNNTDENSLIEDPSQHNSTKSKNKKDSSGAKVGGKTVEEEITTANETGSRRTTKEAGKTVEEVTETGSRRSSRKSLSQKGVNGEDINSSVTLNTTSGSTRRSSRSRKN